MHPLLKLFQTSMISFVPNAMLLGEHMNKNKNFAINSRALQTCQYFSKNIMIASISLNIRDLLERWEYVRKYVFIIHHELLLYNTFHTLLKIAA